MLTWMFVVRIEPSSLPSLRDIVTKYELSARKSLGQHFLFDGNITAKIAASARPLDQGSIIEVGPGPGGLTRALLADNAQELIVVERDHRCLAILEELSAAYPGRLTVIEGDALQTNLASLGTAPRQIVANLPYNIGTALLLQWLKTPQAFQAMTLMFQKEVADRLVAAPGTSAYGRLSVLTQWLCKVDRLFDLSPKAFVPPPKVASTVVRITPYQQPLFPASRPLLERITAAAFGQRRKMLRSSLRSLNVDSLALLSAATIDPTERAEQLSIQDFCRLAEALGHIA